MIECDDDYGSDNSAVWAAAFTALGAIVAAGLPEFLRARRKRMESRERLAAKVARLEAELDMYADDEPEAKPAAPKTRKPSK